MKKKIIAIIFTGIIKVATAQTDVDALRYSGSSVTGSARFTSMSGAFGALGGDFSSLAGNPAGIAVYRKSEFTFTPSISVGSTNSEFLGKSFDDKRYNFNIGNMGLVFTRQLTDDQTSAGWKSWSFGFGYNRLNNFQNQSFYEGVNSTNSLLDNFAENANGHDPSDLDQFYEQLAYDTYLINPDSSNHYSGILPAGNKIQRRTSESRGGTGEIDFSFGGNYSNKLFLGATLGLTSLRYVQSTATDELDPDTMISGFNSFRLREDFTTRGSGVNFKVGMIYRANDFVRLGASIQTPTWYTLTDIYKNSITSDLDTATYSLESPDGQQDYDLNTPFKATASLALIFAKNGLLSFDYEFSDYSESRFDSPEISFTDVNDLIREKYIGVHTLRAGTEWIVQNISLRAGASFSTSPLKDEFTTGNADFFKKGFSAGIGFREDNLFFDLGYAYSESNQFFQPYNLFYQSVPGVNEKIRTNNFTATFGVKF